MGFFDDVVKTVTKPIRSVTKAAGKTLAGIFEDTTQPFLKPIDNLLDSLAPRLLVRGEVGGSVGASISGSTTHNIVFPQIPGPRSAGTIGDVTGGLLSDLAFDSTQLQKAETELDFLESAMRKGVYPHRDDAYFLGISIVPSSTETEVKKEGWIQILVEDYDERTVYAEVSLFLSQDEVKRNVADAAIRFGGNNKIDSETMAALLEQTEKVQLSLPRKALTKMRIKVTALDGAGATADNIFQGIADLNLWVERHNTGFTDVLHRFSCDRPTKAFQISLPLDRREFISEGADHAMNGIDTAAGGLTKSADALKQAKEIAGSLPEPVQAETPTGTDQLSKLLFERVSKAESIRERLREARRSLQRISSEDGVFDFRLRYKIRVSNQVRQPRTIQRLAFQNSASRTGTQSGVWDLEQIDLPGSSVLEVTVYPLQGTDDFVAEADLTMAESQPHTQFSLWGGLGLHDSLLQSRRVVSKNADLPDSATLQWSIRDCCLPRD